MIAAVRTISAFRGAHRFLSNLYPAAVWFEQRLYPSVEYAFQAAKALVSADREWVTSAPTSLEAKRRGRAVQLVPGWNEHRRYTVMEQLLAAKFDPATAPAMAAVLANTGDSVLIEGNNWHDNTWGVCNCCCGVGLNLLGWMLMRQRDRNKYAV
jgi:hypothetical protein